MASKSTAQTEPLPALRVNNSIRPGFVSHLKKDKAQRIGIFRRTVQRRKTFEGLAGCYTMSLKSEHKGIMNISTSRLKQRRQLNGFSLEGPNALAAL